ncbi:diguanylate cyclase [Jatrophihabitans telluris]|uniref:Diguanylate cyclase n=1 Tax=Jatrophihabitans telluris TaxID=2038343 RepID=A0ABY4QUQ0_9ACTN|nr:diguanylate cyclase [Jatrophihabitans telluris]UQX86611.1 diguanylate cyclase [Jatrophihabitans telluris]
MAAVGDQPLFGADLATLMSEIHEAAGRGDFRSGLSLCDLAEPRAAAAGDAVGQARVLRERARLLTWSGDLEQAIAACEDGRELLREHDADEIWCELAIAQAFALTGLGLGEEAMELLTSARTIAQALRHRELLFWVHNRTGFAYDSFGEHESARDLLKYALSFSDAVDKQGRWSILTNLVNNAMSLVPELRGAGREDEAAGVLAESLEHAAEAVTYCEIQDRCYELCLSLGNLGAIQQLSGAAEQALATLEKSHELAVKHDYRPLQMSARQHMPAALLDQGRLDDAIELLTDVLAESVELGELLVQVDVLEELAALYERNGELRKALACFRSFHDAEKQLRHGRASTRARLLAHQAQLEQARNEAADALARNERLLQDKQALLEQTATLERHAQTDALTGLANRRYLDLALPAMHQQAHSQKSSLWIALLDLDHFKQVNDSLGHPSGDRVLVRIAELLRAVCRPDDLIARYGGEEFLVAMLDVDTDTAWRICERLRRRVQDEEWSTIAPGLTVTVSIGLSPDVHDTYTEAVYAADRQLYRAKDSGRNQIASETARPAIAPAGWLNERPEIQEASEPADPKR